MVVDASTQVVGAPASGSPSTLSGARARVNPTLVRTVEKMETKRPVSLLAAMLGTILLAGCVSDPVEPPLTRGTQAEQAALKRALATAVKVRVPGLIPGEVVSTCSTLGPECTEISASAEYASIPGAEEVCDGVAALSAATSKGPVRFGVTERDLPRPSISMYGFGGGAPLSPGSSAQLGISCQASLSAGKGFQVAQALDNVPVKDAVAVTQVTTGIALVGSTETEPYVITLTYTGHRA